MNMLLINTLLSRIEGISLKEIQDEILRNHRNAYKKSNSNFKFTFNSSGRDKFRADKEEHLYNPLTIYKLQQATRRASMMLCVSSKGL